MYQIEKLRFGSLLYVQNDLSFHVLSHQATTMQHFSLKKKAAKLHTARAVKRCDRFIITGKSVLYFKSSGKVKSK